MEKFRQVLNEATDGETCVMVDLSHVTEIDYTALKVSIISLDLHFMENDKSINIPLK